MARTKKTLRIGVGSTKRAKPAAGSRKPPTQWGKSKTLPDPDDKDAEDVELRCGRSKTEKEKESNGSASQKELPSEGFHGLH